MLAVVVAASAAPRRAPTLVWSDEFDGKAGARIDSTKWRYDLGDGCQAGNCGWGNDEKEYYTSASENISLDGRGHLQIVARRHDDRLALRIGAALEQRMPWAHRRPPI